MRLLVIYSSKYGNTKQYAQWIAQETGAGLCDAAKLACCDFSAYDVCLYGGGVYASSIRGFSKFRQLRVKWNGIPTAVFATGFKPEGGDAEQELRRANLTGELEELPLFYLRGGMDKARLRTMDRTLIRMMDKMLKKNGPGIADGDWKSRETLQPILNWIAAQGGEQGAETHESPSDPR